MKNTLENKTKLFAQYWGQKVGKDKSQSNYHITSRAIESIDFDYLELKPLSQISDEDAITLANMKLNEVIKKCIIPNTLDFYKISRKYRGIVLEYKFKDKEGIGASDGFYHSEVFINFDVSKYLSYIIADKIRNLGYALPWNGILVEEQIEFGWIKLKD